jgi:hypothetical protein
MEELVSKGERMLVKGFRIDECKSERIRMRLWKGKSRRQLGNATGRECAKNKAYIL